MKRFLVLMTALTLAGPVLAAERTMNQTERYPVAKGAAVLVDVADMDVALRSGDVPDTAVTTDLRISGVSEDRAARWVEGHTPLVDTVGTGLSIRVPPANYGFLGLGLLTAHAKLDIVTPSTVIPDVTTTSGEIHIRGDFAGADPLRLRTAKGDMEFEGAARSLDIRTTSGDVRIEVVRPLEKLFARTADGDVTVSGGARQVHVDTASGNIWLTNLSGPVEVETSTGKVTLRWDRLEAGTEVRVSNHSGRTRLVLPAGVTPQGTITSTSGRIRCALPGTISEDGTTVTLEGDGPKLSASTVSGEITVDTGSAGWEISSSEKHQGRDK